MRNLLAEAGLSLQQVTGARKTLCAWRMGRLLYGHEVPMPEWLTPRRRRAYRARPHPAPRRCQVERLLDTDLSNSQIAARLGVTSGAIRYQVACIRRQHGVSDREELRALLRPAQAEPRAAG